MEGSHILSDGGDKKLTEPGIYMEADAPAMFTLKMLKGNYSGLKEMNSIFISSSAAKAFFADADPINKLLKIDNKLSVKVTGVYEELPRNTFFANLAFIAPWDLYASSETWFKICPHAMGKQFFSTICAAGRQCRFQYS